MGRVAGRCGGLVGAARIEWAVVFWWVVFGIWYLLSLEKVVGADLFGGW